jgi:23S rRNA pseudouridine1911/1915/1917 synthase
VTDDDELEAELVRVEIDAARAGGRLDAVIAAAIASLSRAQVQRLIDDGNVTVNGEVATKAGARVRAGDVIEIAIPPPEPLEVLAEAIPLVILYEDADLIVIDKPAGLVVHPAAGHATGTLVNALLHHCTDLAGIGGVLRPGIVHRLDKDTSGVMVATKTDRAHAALTAAFAAKSRGEAGGIERTYLAITSPAPPAKAGTLRTQYGRHPVHRKKFSSKVTTGKPAVTHWEIVEALHEAALVRFRLETGRTHQIRVHASDHGFALVGDPVYGHKPRDERLAEVARTLGRQALHAATLAFDHPATGTRLAFESPLPADLVAARAALARS